MNTAARDVIFENSGLFVEILGYFGKILGKFWLFLGESDYFWKFWVIFNLELSIKS